MRRRGLRVTLGVRILLDAVFPLTEMVRGRGVSLVLSVGVLLTAGMPLALTHMPRLQKRYNPPALILPAENEVIEMRASLREFKGRFQEIPEFEVPAGFVPGILAWIQPGVRTSDRWALHAQDELGEVFIRTHDGRDLRLRFYWAGTNPPVLTPNGKDTYWGRGVNHDGYAIDGGMRLGYEVKSAHEASRR